MFVETKIREDQALEYQDWNILNHIGEKDERVRGGSLVKCHPSLRMGKANPPSINNRKNETLHFTLPFKEEKLHIFLVYIHPCSKIEETIFTKALQYKYAIIIGDFNVNKVKKRQINNFIQNSNFIQVPTMPTFLMNNNPDSTPDIILHTSNLKNNVTEIELTPDLGSDHLAMMIELDLEKPIQEEQGSFTYNFNKCNIKKLNKAMEEYIEQNRDKSIDEEMIELFNEKLSNTIKANTPTISHTHYLHELPPYIIKLIKNKRKIYREYCRNASPNLKQKINEYNKNVQKMIHQYREHTWIRACNKINESKGRSFYQETKKLSRYKQYNKIPTLIENGRSYSEDTEKVEMFAKHYENAFNYDNDDDFDKTHERKVNQWYEKFFTTPKNIPPEKIKIDRETYFQIVNNSKNSAPGVDYIPWKIVKKLSDEIHEHLISIYEYCLNQEIYPKIWKKGCIITVPKANMDHSKSKNYRPITLLPVLGKIYEKIIRIKLMENLQHQLPVFQFGFQNQKSTTHPLTIFISNTQNATLKNYKTSAISLDINKAFDSVWHKGLLFKLNLMKTPRYLLNIIRDFLENRQLCVRIKNSNSYIFVPQQGTPQGSPLSPLLYNLYCADIFNSESQFQYVLQYADDTLLISHQKNITKCIEQLQELMRKIEVWFRIWRLKPNPTKSQFIIFNHRLSSSSPTISICNEQKNPQQAIKYLGVYVDSKMNFNQHTSQMKKKTISRAKHFSRLVIGNQGLSVANAAKIYKTICRPILEYAHPILINCRNPAIQNIQTAERIALRTISRIRHPHNRLHNPPNELLYEKTMIQPISDRFQKLNSKFYSRLEGMAEIIKLYHEDLNNNPTRKYPTHSLLQKLREEYRSTS